METTWNGTNWVPLTVSEQYNLLWPEKETEHA